ncbi:MAG: 3-deoxy-manno-octulosonate cytidylyltransferase [Bacteroidota bacterium]
MENKVAIVIPARYESSRFPGKPLVEIKGKSMIQRVYERCCLVENAEVWVATDDQRIFESVQSFGGRVKMTSTSHRTGTSRVAEVAAGLRDVKWIINVQGDEPFISPTQIQAVIEVLAKGAEIATLLRAEKDMKHMASEHVVKAVRGRNGRALYFSRSLIPFVRNTSSQHTWYQHVGMYGFLRSTLLELMELPPTILEETESLEQLGWLSHGYSIMTALTDEESIGVDIPADLEEIERRWEEIQRKSGSMR